MDNVVQESHTVSVMTPRHLATVVLVRERDEKDDRLFPHSFRSQRLTAKDEKHLEESGKKEECPSNKKVRNSMPIQDMSKPVM